MSNIKYVGMDVHKSITVICVLNEAGQVEGQSKIKTKADILSSFFRGLDGTVHVALEEGSWSVWLYNLLRPLVSSVLVCETRHNRLNHARNKSDDEDAEELARRLRLGELRPVYKGDRQQQELRELFRAYDNLVTDATRIQNRIKALYRGRGLDCAGHSVLRPDLRAEWLAKLPEESARFRAESQLTVLDGIQEQRKKAKARLLGACRKQAIWSRLVSLPGIGPVRAATLLAIVWTASRFRTKRLFWAYCGLAVVTHSSADYVESNGRIVRQQKKTQTRGLNRNRNQHLKRVFKGAAISALQYDIFRKYYDDLVDAGTRPEMARLSVARKLAAIVLSVWQQDKDYDPEKVFAKA